MIVEEINLAKEKEIEVGKIKSMWDIKLPKYYFLEELNNELHITKKKGLYRGDLATLNLKEDKIVIRFSDEKDLEKLRNCIDESKIKFKIVVGKDYY